MGNEIAEALSRAAEILESEGWIQGAAHGPLGHCTIGAIAVATGQDLRHGNGWSTGDEARRHFGPTCRAVEDFLTLPGDPTQNIPQWNDDPLRTREQVTKTLRAVAEAQTD